MLRTVAFVLFVGVNALMAAFIAPVRQAQAQEARIAVSQCQAIAQSLPGEAIFANIIPVAASGLQFVQSSGDAMSAREDVRITYIGHSTYFIETPGGIGIATDYSGVHRPVRMPDVVTMNKAHSTHFTLRPDAGIAEVLHGWSDVPGEAARHDIVVGDAYIRNVTTDIRSWGGGFEEDGNSIFIFEIAGLCIGHLGHLHHELTDSHYTQIGRLDILMVPVDGGLTMGADSMGAVVERLRSSLILPMHRPSGLGRFLSMLSDRFDIVHAREPVITVSVRTLPRRPTILVPQGM